MEEFLESRLSQSEFLLIKDYGEVGVNITVCTLSHWVKYWLYGEKCAVRIPRLQLFRMEMQEFINALSKNKKCRNAMGRMLIMGINRN